MEIVIYGAKQPLPISSAIVRQMSLGTIKNVLDAVVELVTNSDDSYIRLEENNVKVSGRIEISIERLKGGGCKKLKIVDFAEGMSQEKLKEAVTFAEEKASGFEKGKSVRGLLGRGLKEAIIALGIGEIYTIKNNKVNAAKIWLEKGKPYWCLGREKPAATVIREELGILEGNGTVVQISVTNEKIQVPDYRTFERQIRNHYALRDINSSKKRDVFLHFETQGRTIRLTSGKAEYSGKITYKSPEGRLVCDEPLNLPGYGDKVLIKFYETSQPLDSPRNNPLAQGGLLIKTKGAILDNQLFEFSNEPAALYFYGEAFCEGIANRIRNGEMGIIDQNRGGIEWRHEFCQALQYSLEKLLRNYVNEKKKELEKASSKEIPQPTQKMLSSLRSLLNKLAKEELEELEIPIEPDAVDDLMIKPEVANLEIDKPRSFSVYAPKELVELSKTNMVEVDSDNPEIVLLKEKVFLGGHPKYANVCYGTFEVIGKLLGAEGYLSCKLGDSEDMAQVKVGPQRKIKGKKKKLVMRRGGFISDIRPDETNNPIQRVEYNSETGEIKIFVKFPVVAKYLGPGLRGANTPGGRAFLAELVGEAFFRAIAMNKLNSGAIFYNPNIPGSEINAYNTEVSNLQNKMLHLIHDLLARWKFK